MGKKSGGAKRWQKQKGGKKAGRGKGMKWRMKGRGRGRIGEKDVVSVVGVPVIPMNMNNGAIEISNFRWGRHGVG